MRLLNELTSITLYRTSLPHRRCYSFPPPPPPPTPTTAAAVDPSTTVVTTLPRTHQTRHPPANTHPSHSLPIHPITLAHPSTQPTYNTTASISAVRPYRWRCHGDRYCCTHQYSFLPPPHGASPTTTTTPRRGPSPSSPPSTVHRQTVTPTTRRRHRRPFFY